MIKKETQILGIIGIIIGIIIGLLISLILSRIINIALHSYHYDILSYGALELIVNKTTFHMRVPAVFLALNIIIIYSIIYISNIFAMRKINKQNTIETIRNIANTKIKKKILKTPKSIEKIFGEEGVIGYKNIKKDKSRHKTIVVSIVISIILFLCISGLITDYFKKTLYGQLSPVGDFNDYEIELSSYEGVEGLIEYLNDNELINDYIAYETIPITNANIYLEDKDIAPDMKKIIDKGLYKEYFEGKMQLSIQIKCFKDKAYNEILKKAGITELKKDEVIITNSIKLDGIKFDVTNYKVGDTYTVNIGNNIYNASNGTYENKEIQKELKIVAIIEEVEPYIYLNGNISYISILQIVNEETLKDIGETYLKTKDYVGEREQPTRTILELNTDKAYEIQLKEEEIKKLPYVTYLGQWKLYYQSAKSQKIITEMLIYTFIALLTSIAAVNIYNIIYFSILLRKKDFAELKSIGMSNKQINRMTILEGILYAIDSLIFGISISVGILYIYYIIQTYKPKSIPTLFHIPWLNILICLLLVYTVIFLAIRNAKKKIKESNIIDEIKNENI